MMMARHHYLAICWFAGVTAPRHGEADGIRLYGGFARRRWQKPRERRYRAGEAEAFQGPDVAREAREHA